MLLEPGTTIFALVVLSLELGRAEGRDLDEWGKRHDVSVLCLCEKK